MSGRFDYWLDEYRKWGDEIVFHDGITHFGLYPNTIYLEDSRGYKFRIVGSSLREGWHNGV